MLLLVHLCPVGESVPGRVGAQQAHVGLSQTVGYRGSQQRPRAWQGGVREARLRASGAATGPCRPVPGWEAAEMLVLKGRTAASCLHAPKPRVLGSRHLKGFRTQDRRRKGGNAAQLTG